MDYGAFNVRTDVNACDCARGPTDTVRESALKVDSGRKIPGPGCLSLHFSKKACILQADNLVHSRNCTPNHADTVPSGVISLVTPETDFCRSSATSY